MSQDKIENNRCDRCHAVHGRHGIIGDVWVDYYSVAVNESPVAHAHLCEPCGKELGGVVIAAVERFMSEWPASIRARELPG